MAMAGQILSGLQNAVGAAGSISDLFKNKPSGAPGQSAVGAAMKGVGMGGAGASPISTRGNPGEQANSMGMGTPPISTQDMTSRDQSDMLGGDWRANRMRTR